MVHNTSTLQITQILSAIKNGDSEKLKNLLNEGCELNVNFKELNPMYLAIKLDRPRTVELLIKHGVNVNLTIEPLKKHTALQRAVMQGNKEIISMILKHTTSWNTTDTDGASLLHLAMEAPKTWTREDKIIAHLTIFLDLGADIEAKTLRGETALFIAAKYNFQKVVKFLFERKADLNVRDVDDNSLVQYMLNHLHTNDQHYKFKEARVYFLKWLLSNGVDANFINKTGQTPMHSAVKAKSGNSVKLLFEHLDNPYGFRDNRDRTMLHVILELCEEESFLYNRTYKIEKMIDCLLDKGLSIDARDVDGNTTIHTAAKWKKWSVMPKLLESYSDVNARNHRGQTALHVAIDHRDPYLKGYRYAVEALIAKGIDIEIRDNDGLNAVQLAAKNKHKWILKLLKDLGSDLKVITTSGENLLHLFASNDYSGEYNLDPAKDECINSNEIDVSDNFYKKMKACFGSYQCVNDGMVEMLIEEGNDINAMNVDGLTPLHVALEARNTDILGDLIKHGADVNFREKRSQLTPIFIAVKQYHIGHCEDIDILIQAGADVNAIMSGKTIVHNLVKHETDVIQKVLRAGGFCNVKDEFGYTPIYYAMKVNNYVAMAYLLEAGANIRVVDVKDELKRILKCSNICEYLLKYERVELDVAEAFGSYSSRYVRDDYFGTLLDRKCREEVTKMKEVMIDEYKSLWHFLRLNLRQQVYCINYCEKLSSIVELSNLELNFPLYCNVIMGKYLMALERKQLLDDARDVLRRIAGFALPDICVDDIFRGLDDLDLRSLVDKR